MSIQAFALALKRASEVSSPVDEQDSQVTAPLQTHLAAPVYHVPPKVAQIVAQTEVVPKPSPASALQNQNRVRMLRRLRRSYNDLMSQSLQGAAWLELGIASKPDAVQNATNLMLHVGRRAVHHLPAGTSMTSTYDEAEHELLILGEPGAGKSTLLLDLAQQLVLRAEIDETHPLPVILPLSTWAVRRLRLEDWIAEQMSEIYDVPRKLSGEWVQEGHILPLLDGLDEMEETARAACIAVINAYHRDHMAALVVCSRTTEYEAATEEHSRLALQGAVVVQPLTHSDVDAYLERAGQPLTALRSALEQNEALHDLVTKPLMLNILTMTYQGTSMRDLPNKEAVLLQQVWDDYIERMVMRKGDSKRYPLPQTRVWLSYLARQMRDHNQAVFYLEHLQPDWLFARQQRTYAWQAIHLPTIMIGVLISILVYLFLFRDTTHLISLLQYGVLGGLLGELWHRSKSQEGSQAEHHHMWGKRLIKRLAVSACIGLIYGLSDGLYTNSPIDGLSYGVVIGLGSLLLQYLLALRSHPGMSSGKNDPRRWKRVVRFGSVVPGLHALLVTVIIWLSIWLSYGLTYGLSFGPSFGLNYGLNYGLSYGLIFGLFSGLSYALIGLTLRIQMGDVRPAERMRWIWSNLRRGLFDSRHLRITGLLTCTSMISLGLSYGLFYRAFYGLSAGLSAGLSIGLSVGLSIGLSIGLSYWLLVGLFQGIAQERIEDQDRRVANQGIHRSLRNSVTMGIVGGAVIGSTGMLSKWLSFGLNNWLNYGPRFELGNLPGLGLLISISGALLICMLTGGLAAWRHSVIRFLLWRSRTFPMVAPQFLNDATARFLLRRVGGGYSFAHRLLLDHLADMEAVPKAAPSSPPPLHPE